MATYENVDYGSPDGALIGLTSTNKIGFHGIAPTSMRAGAAQATSLLASSTDFTATHLAALVEVMNALAAKGIWKGAA